MVEISVDPEVRPIRPLQPGAERLVWADLSRVVAMFAVVVLHAAAPLLVQFHEQGAAAWWIGNVYDSAARWCVPLFVMVSGALLLGRTQPPRRFLRSRATKVLVPFAAWTAVYFFWAIWFRGRAWEPADLLRTAIERPVYYHLWFFYVLIGLYLLAPVLDVYLRAARPRELRYLLALWFAWASLLPLLEGLFGLEVYLSPGPATSPLMLLGYFVLGHLLRDVRPSSRQRVWLAAAFTAGLAVTAGGTYYVTVLRGGGEFDGSFYEYYSANVVVMSVALFLLLKSSRALHASSPRLRGALRSLSVLVLGIYLVHAMLIDVLKSGRLGFELDASAVHPAAGVPLFALVVFAASALLVALLRRIPIVARIVP